jgi:hypothetical protein
LRDEGPKHLKDVHPKLCWNTLMKAFGIDKFARLTE